MRDTDIIAGDRSEYLTVEWGTCTPIMRMTREVREREVCNRGSGGRF